jgi:hypothetical protein
VSVPRLCPICGGTFSLARLPEGFVYCMEGHVLTVARFSAIDPRNLERFRREEAVDPRERSRRNVTSIRATLREFG